MRFVKNYNSGDEIEFVSSLTLIYKAWDTLFQSDQILVGHSIREKSKKYDFGEIKGLTDLYLGPVSARASGTPKDQMSKAYRYPAQKYVDKWHITELKYSMSAPFQSKLFNTLDLLREIRNGEQHDVLTNHHFSYTANVNKTNVFIKPLVNAYLEAYDQVLKATLEECLRTPKPGEHNHRSSPYCARKSILATNALRAQTRFPLAPYGTISKRTAFSRFLNEKIRKFENGKSNRRELLTDSFLKPSTSENEEYTHFPYRSIKEITIQAGLEPSAVRRVRSFLNRHPMALGGQVRIYTMADGSKITLYSEEVVTFLKGHLSPTRKILLTKECCY